ncbi:MAG: LPS-assembly protein LptD [Elusimicrobia bacterium]|nr:LPS-assembly protein LptD [Elusimicrobiota bacterium]
MRIGALRRGPRWALLLGGVFGGWMTAAAADLPQGGRAAPGASRAPLAGDGQAQGGAVSSTGSYRLPDAPASHVRFSSDQLDFQESSSVMHLKGNVLLRESTWTVRADELWIHSESRTAHSEGYLFLNDGYSAVHGSRGEFDLKTHEGWLDDPRTSYGDWNVKAKSVRAGANKKLSYRGARFSGCDSKPHQHYHLYSGKLDVVPKKYLLAYNTVFFLGPVPILWLPVFFTPLRDFRFWDSRLQVGYDRRNGVFVKTNFMTQYSESVYSKLFIDGYTSQGLGLGGELHRRKSDDSRGGLFAYWVKEQSTKDNRWAVVADQYQALTSSISAQARIQAQSDAEFNNHYARSKAFMLTPELVNGGALTYRLPSAVARLSYSRTDVDDGTRRRFVKDKESVPRLDIQSSPLRFWRLPWINTLAGFADNSFDRRRGFQQRSVGASWEGTRSVRLFRGASFTPKAGYSQTYLDRMETLNGFSSTETLKDAFIGRYKAEGNLRVNTRIGAWDLTHAYRVRQKPGSFAEDSLAMDHGVESNMLSLQDTFRPARKILVRVASGYEFRVFRDRYLGFRDRVQPLVAELTYSPRVDLSFSFREDYQLAQGNRSVLFSGYYGEPDKEFVSLGVGYNQALPKNTLVNFEFGWEPSSSGWRLGGNLASDIVSEGGFGGIRTFSLFQKEFTVQKKLHDFNLRALTRFRPGGVREFAFHIEMRFPGTRKKDIAKRDWESEWFPERKYGMEERP